MLFRYAMMERGCVNIIRDALEVLDDADAALATGQLDGETAARLERQIAGSRQDLQFEQSIADSTFYGAFPLVRFVKGTYLSDPKLIARFELWNDPKRSASKEALDAMIAGVKAPQCDVIILSDPIDEDLEREYLVTLGRLPKFFVRTGRQLVGDISDEQLRSLVPPKPDTPLPAVLIGNRPLLFVLIRKADEVRRYHRYVVEGYLYSGPEKPDQTLSFSGYCIDRRSVLPLVVSIHVVLLLVAPFLYRELVRLSSVSRRPPDWKNTFAIGGLGFVWGRILVWGLAPLLSRSEPAPESGVLESFWWPAAFGPAFILGPAAVARFAEQRFSFLGTAFVMYNRWGAVFAVVAFGGSSYLIQAVLHYDDTRAAGMIVPILVGGPLAGFIVGRSLDKADNMPLWAGACAAAVTLAIGLAWCSASTFWLWATLIPLAVVAGIALTAPARVATKKAQTAPGSEAAAEAPAEEPDEESKTPTVETLIEAACAPAFHETPAMKGGLDALKGWFEGGFTIVGLHGPAGRGKSATMNAIVERVRRQVPDVKLLRGSCHEPQGGGTPEPFEVFREAIAGHFAVNLLAPGKDEIKHIDQALGGLFDSVVPFAPLLFPPSKAGTGQSGSKREMFVSIAAMLERLASEHPVLMLLDDTHWIDPGSLELLSFLIGEFNARPECRIGVVLAGRAPENVAIEKVTEKAAADAPRNVHENIQLVSIDPLTRSVTQAVLVQSLRMHEETADNLLTAVADDENNNLFWLFQVVVHLARQGIFVWRDDAFVFKEGIDSLGSYLPDDYSKSLVTTLEEHPEFRPILECAACIGFEFTVSQLSNGVGRSRLDLLQMLHRIESETGIIVDELANDDVFAFRSSFMLEMLRKVLNVRAEGPKAPVAPQIIREFHYRLGDAAEPAAQESTGMLYAAANHYYASGASHGEKGMYLCLDAAKAACREYQYDTARRYLEMADECGDAAGVRDRDFDREVLLLECEAAHVEGTRRVETAERTLQYIADRPDAPFEIYRATAQASYDAGIDTRDQTHFANCVSVAEKMIDLFDKPLEQAEARHFWGIGLPVSDAENRRKHLRFAMALVDGEDEDNPGTLLLKSRIANSLAEQLSYGDADDKRKARELFHVSLNIKQSEDIGDIEGLAYVHGGLGRLAYFADPPEIDTARYHFQEDLKYSKRIGSRTGQTKMHSLLGGCDVRQDRHEDALVHYQAAHELSESTFDTYFALAGLLECLGTLKRPDDADKFGRELVKLVRSGLESLDDDTRRDNPVAAIPRFCVDSIKSALERCETSGETDWHRWLTGIVNHNNVPD